MSVLTPCSLSSLSDMGTTHEVTRLVWEGLVLCVHGHLMSPLPSTLHSTNYFLKNFTRLSACQHEVVSH